MIKYKIEFTEDQMRVVQLALEEWFRLRLGQSMDFADDVCRLDRDVSLDDPNHKTYFREFLENRDRVSNLMEAVFYYAFLNHRTPQKKSEDMLIAEDIWDSIRLARGRSNWDRVLVLSNEPCPKIEVIEDGN